MAHDIYFAYTPIPVHTPFHTSSAYERALFGAFGSGKTYGICAEAIAWCLEQPGIRGLITRKTVPELRDTTETVFFEILPHELYQAGEVRRMGGHVESFTFPNGSKVLFRSIDDWQKHKSLNVGFIAWDEADEFDEETYLGMLSRVRQREPTPEGQELGATEITRRGMWSASNPSGHNWLYHRFVNPAKREANTEWFRSTSFDNPYLPPEYLDALLQYPDPWVRRYVLCQFDDFAGQIYEGWGWDTHVVEPYDLERGSVVWMGMDPGTRNPTAGLWVHVDAAKRTLTGFAEYEESGLTVVRHAMNWRQIESKHQVTPTWRVADPSITTRDRGTAMKLSDQYRKAGYSFALGPKRYEDRIPMLGALIAQHRFRLTRNCPRAYEAIKAYKWEDMTPAMRAKDAEPQEVPHKKGSDLVDCAQYLASRWVAPMRLAAIPKDESFSDEARRIIRKNLQRKRIARGLPTSVGRV